MATHPLFLSYKRSADTTPVVERFYKRIKAQLARHGVEPFFDRRSIEAGEKWQESIDDFMARATHFVALISIDFWLSEQCRRELELAIGRYAKEGVPRLLFVLADQLSPDDLAFDEAEARSHTDANASSAEGERRVAEAAERVRKVKGIGDFNFLGPHDPQSGALVRLEFENPAKWDLQLAQLVESIKGLKGLKGIE